MTETPERPGPTARPPIPTRWAAAAIAAFGAILIAGLGMAAVQRARAEAADSIAAEFSKNANLALALEVQTHQLLNGVDQLLMLIKNQYERAGPARPIIKDLMAPMMSRSRSITFAGATNAAGDVIESVLEFTATNVADREFFRAHQRTDTGRLLISEPVLGRVSGRWAITLTRRLNTPDGRFNGIVAISIEPSYLTELFENTTLGPSDVMSLVLANGVTLARRRGPSIEFGENIAHSQLLAEHARRPEGNYIGPGGVDGYRRVFSYRTMRDYPVIVTVATLEADVLAATQARARSYYANTAFAGVAIFFACAAGIVLYARQQRAQQQLLEQETRRRQLEQQFYRAQRMQSIGTLAGGIAHDLNNVLTPITMGLEILREKLPDADSREILDTMIASARRGAEMVRQVLTFARGKTAAAAEVHIGELVDDVVRIVRDTLPKTISIETSVAPALPPIHGDPTQLHQVLLNLCVNARDAMPDGGRLTITAQRTREGHSLRLSVADTGAGISPELLDKIFDPFFTTKEPGKGTGLGLSTSLSIVEAHGGSMTVDSEPGQGTDFYVHLPIAEGPLPEPASPPAPPSRRGEGQTLLVVDDEEPVRVVLKNILERAGFRVLQAVNGRDALAVFRSHRPEIAAVLMDMTMPVMGGVQAIRELARVDPSVRIIAASGIHDTEKDATSAGPQVRQFLAKPFSAETVLRAVDRVLER